jgi:undecaprenyl-diphosphatase
MSAGGRHAVDDRPDHHALGADPGAAPPESIRPLAKWVVALGLALGYLLFTAAVHLRLLNFLDLAVRRASRPDDVWGRVQIDASGLAQDLQPIHLAVPLLALAAVLGVARRSYRPLAVVAAVGLPVAAVTLATKWLMAHTDTSASPPAHGSFPSGHTVTAITVFGLVVLLVWAHPRWRWLLPAVMGCVVGAALVLASIHPATDVIGAGLLAAAALTGASAAGLGTWGSGGAGAVQGAGAR